MYRQSYEVQGVRWVLKALDRPRESTTHRLTRDVFDSIIRGLPIGDIGVVGREVVTGRRKIATLFALFATDSNLAYDMATNTVQPDTPDRPYCMPTRTMLHTVPWLQWFLPAKRANDSLDTDQANEVTASVQDFRVSIVDLTDQPDHVIKRYR